MQDATGASVDAGAGGGSVDGGSRTADGGTDSAAPEGGPGTCTADWCIQQSPPNTVSLSNIWGSSATDIWVTGDGGTLLHWNGTTWSSSLHGAANLKGIWGSSANDIWVTGDLARFSTTMAPPGRRLPLER